MIPTRSGPVAATACPCSGRLVSVEPVQADLRDAVGDSALPSAQQPETEHVGETRRECVDRPACDGGGDEHGQPRPRGGGLVTEQGRDERHEQHRTPRRGARAR